MKQEEIQAARALNIYLNNNRHICSWEPGANPPDALFHVDGNDWDVEITEMHQQLAGGEIPISRTCPEKKMMNLINSMKDESESFRRHDYSVSLMGPFQRKELDDIKSNILELIQNEFIGRKDLFGDGRAIVIGRSNGKRKLVGLVGFNGTTKLPNGRTIADISASIDYCIKKIIDEKNQRFVAMGGRNKKVLLVDNRFFFAEPENILVAIKDNMPINIAVDEIYLKRDNKIDLIWARAFRGIERS
jgi:hypothetical protein